MRIHPQIFKTLQMIERLRRQRKVQRLEIRFGPDGLERVWVDGIETVDITREVKLELPKV
jgi:hypothetical protein